MPLPDLDKLTLSDDLMFTRVFSTEIIVKSFLEKLLGVEIDRIAFIEEQRTVKDKLGAHGVRFDVYLRDDKGTVYNIEMQKSSEAMSLQRIRFYQSSLDIEHLKMGFDYKQLPETFIIIVCTFDMFAGNKYPVYGWAKYELGNFVKLEDTAMFQVDMGNHVIILNSKYSVANADAEIISFLNYLNSEEEAQITTSTLVQMMDSRVDELRTDELFRRDYMSLDEILQRERADGEKTGAEKAKRELISTLAKSMSVQEIAKKLELTVQEVQKFLTGGPSSSGSLKDMNLT